MSFIQHLISFSDVTVATSLVGSNTYGAQEVMRETNGAGAKANGVIDQNREQPLIQTEAAILVQLFKHLVKLPLDEHDRQIELLQRRINQLHHEHKVSLTETLLDLTSSNNQLRSDLENYQANQKESWADFKRRFNQQLVQIGMTIYKLSKQND